MSDNEGTARTHFDVLAEELAPEGVSVGSMFGHRSLMYSGAGVSGKAIACLEVDTMVFRLGADSPAHAEAMAMHGAHLFDPSKTGREMKDWVVVPTSTSDRWPDWAHAAVAALPPKS
jgi:hypothetical protein